MRRSFLILFTMVLMVSSGALVRAESTPFQFSENLSLGSSGPQVLALQKILNRDVHTQIARTGPGSPGNETDYFGFLTKQAVIRFQEKYSSQTMVPAGLTQGTGYVGSYTRIALNSLSMTQKDTVVVATTTPTLFVPPSVSTSTAANPNLDRINEVFAAIEKAGAQQGMSSALITKLNHQILEYASATTTDLRATFLRMNSNAAHQAKSEDSPLGHFFAKIAEAFGNIFPPTRAYAQSSDTAFGGNLIFTFPCTCSSNGDWFVVLQPVGPSYVALLETAISAGQYASYNIPFTPAVLGFYSSRANGCSVGVTPYCYSVPVEGQIQSKTGSAP